MENFIKEGKGGFDFACVSSSSKKHKPSSDPWTCIQFIQLVSAYSPCRQYEKTAYRYNTFKTA